MQVAPMVTVGPPSNAVAHEFSPIISRRTTAEEETNVQDI